MHVSENFAFVDPKIETRFKYFRNSVKFRPMKSPSIFYAEHYNALVHDTSFHASFSVKYYTGKIS